MFTGIVQGKGKIADKRSVGGGMVFVVEADFELTDPEEGESIAHNGVCLTARDISGRRYEVDVSPDAGVPDTWPEVPISSPADRSSDRRDDQRP